MFGDLRGWRRRTLASWQSNSNDGVPAIINLKGGDIKYVVCHVV